MNQIPFLFQQIQTSIQTIEKHQEKLEQQFLQIQQFPIKNPAILEQLAQINRQTQGQKQVFKDVKQKLNNVQQTLQNYLNLK